MSMSLPVIFLAGMGTILTPCVLPLIPIYLGALSGFGIEEAEKQGVRGRLKVVAGSLSFILGFTIVFVALGLVSSIFGQALSSHRQILTQLGGLLVFVFGLKFMGLLDLGFMEREARLKMPKAGNFFGNVAFGVVFALGWTPCIGPVLGSVLTYTASTATSPLAGAGYLLAYAAGFAIPLLAVAFLLGTAVSLMDRLKKHMQKIQKAGGVALVFVGVLLITGNISMMTGNTASAGATAEKCGDLTEPGVPAFVQFKAPGCSICREMEPTLDQLTSDCSGVSVKIREVVVEDSSRSALVKKHRIVGYPTFLFMDSEGNEVARLVGRQNLDVLRQHMTLLTGKSCPLIGSRDGTGPPEINKNAQAPPRRGAKEDNSETVTCNGEENAGEGKVGVYCEE